MVEWRGKSGSVYRSTKRRKVWDIAFPQLGVIEVVGKEEEEAWLEKLQKPVTKLALEVQLKCVYLFCFVLF